MVLRSRSILLAFRSCVAWTLLAVVAAAADPPAASPASVAVVNPSFEQSGAKPAWLPGWSADARVYSLDTALAHEGKQALKWVNQDPARYALCSQSVPLKAGAKYQISAWVKTQDLKGSESGATICLEWQRADGKWLGGHYPAGVRGTHDWRRIEGVTRLPADAAGVKFCCYVRKGMTGTAWFDDVQIRRIFDPALETMLLVPGYRGWLTDAGPREAVVRYRLNQRDRDLAGARLAARLDGQTLALDLPALDPAAAGAGEGVLRVPVASLAPGRHRLEVELRGADGHVLQVQRHELLRLAATPTAGCRIDEHRRLIVDGKPFFPLGLYCSSIQEADLKLLAAGKFNCLMAYGSPTQQQMDLAQQYRLKVIYSIKDWYFGSRWCPKSIVSVADEERAVRQRVREYRQHPALLAWYLNDELSQSFLPQLEAHHRWVAEEDADHPTWSVLYQYREVSDYRDSFDVIGTDPYPIGRKPASMAAEWTRETFRGVGQARALWQVPQVFNWANYHPEEAAKCHTPTADEMRSMAWQCIAEGATGLVFYSLYDLKRNPDAAFEGQWGALTKIVAQIDRLAAVLLSVEPAPQLTVPDQSGWLHTLVRRHGGKVYVVAVNDGDGGGRVRFQLAGAAGPVRVVGEDRQLAAAQGQFEDDLPALAVRIYELGP